MNNFLGLFKRIIFIAAGLFFVPAGFLLALDKPVLAAESPGAEKIAVIAYHEVLPHPEKSDAANTSVMSLDEFARQMEYLHKNGYYTATIDELEGYVKFGRKLPPRTVVITFDDGYESNYLYCYPYFLKYNFRATIFLMGSVPPNARPHLTGLQLLDMTGSGLIQIGCHTYGLHREIDGQPALKVLAEPEIADDFNRFNCLCRIAGIKGPTSIAYPYGVAGPAAVVAAQNAGYRTGFTTTKGYVRYGDSPMALNRFMIDPETSIETFAAIVSGAQGQ